VERCASTSSKIASICGVVQQGLCLTGLDGIAQGGGAIWCRGGIDGRPAKVNAKIHVLKMVCG
jgi:hypothetical protein